MTMGFDISGDYDVVVAPRGARPTWSAGIRKW